MASGVQLPRYFATVWLAATLAESCGRVAVEAGAEVAAELEEAEEALLEALLLAALEALLEALLEDEAAALLATLDELDELAGLAGPIEHQALLVKLLAGKSDVWQLKLPVSVAYTKLPDLSSATEWVPLMLQLPPIWAHFV